MSDVHPDELGRLDAPLPTPRIESGALRPWTVSGALSAGWDRVRRFWPVLVFAPIVAGLIMQALGYVLSKIQGLGDDVESVAMGIVNGALALGLSAFLAVGLIRMFLAAGRAQKPQFTTLFVGSDRFFSLLVTQVLLSVAITAGLCLFVVPGVVLALGFCMAPFVCVDQKLGAVASLEASWALTYGSKVSLFWFACASMLVTLAGALALGIGVLVALPVIYAALAWIYLRLRGELVPDRLGEPA